MVEENLHKQSGRDSDIWHFFSFNFLPDFLLQYLNYVNNGVEFAAKMDDIDTIDYDGERTYKDIQIMVSSKNLVIIL